MEQQQQENEERWEGEDGGDVGDSASADVCEIVSVGNMDPEGNIVHKNGRITAQQHQPL